MQQVHGLARTSMLQVKKRKRLSPFDSHASLWAQALRHATWWADVETLAEQRSREGIDGDDSIF